MIGVLLLALAPLQGAPKPAVVPRPHDPWVFRSVLDGRPRMVTIALDDDMWIAYDATSCGVYRAWKGGVDFDGAVYTTQHGPQPTAHGPLYVEGYDLAAGESIWDVTYQRGPETVREPARAVWRGYRVDHTTKVTLLYDIVLPDGGTVRVEENPEFVRPMDRFTEEQIENIGVPSQHPGLVRVFRVIDPPDGIKLGVRLRTDGALFKQSLGLERESFEDIEVPGAETVTRIHSHLVLGKGRTVNYLLLFFDKRPASDEPGPEEEAR